MAIVTVAAKAKPDLLFTFANIAKILDQNFPFMN